MILAGTETEMTEAGMAEAEMITRSPAWISTCLWVEKAMRKRADMASPWLPVVMIQTEETEPAIRNRTIRYPDLKRILYIQSLM